MQCGFICDDNRLEPDVLWLLPRRYGKVKPTAKEVLLLIEVSDSSLADDLQEKAVIYTQAGVLEYWVVDVHSSRIHVMSEIVDGAYRSVEIVASPDPLAPRCLPTATLDTKELFKVV